MKNTYSNQCLLVRAGSLALQHGAVCAASGSDLLVTLNSRELPDQDAERRRVGCNGSCSFVVKPVLQRKMLPRRAKVERSIRRTTAVKRSSDEIA